MFLEHVSISDFRPYGSFALDLPSPGVTILVGPNGLGKSAFFEAVEWALTGRAQRLEDLPKERARRSYLPRLLSDGKTSASCHVELSFSGMKQVRRIHGSELGRGSDDLLTVLPETTLADLLKASDWPLPISEESLRTYLRSTHFLGQAASLRLTDQDPRDRWERLSQLNGSGFVSRVQAQLMTRATTTALRRAVETAEGDVRSAEEQKDHWVNLLDRRNGLREGSLVEGALDPGEVYRRSAKLPQGLARFAPKSLGAEGDARGALVSARNALDEADRQLVAVRTRLEGLQQLPRDWAEQQHQIADLRAEEEQATKRRDDAAQQLEQHRATLQESRDRRMASEARQQEIESYAVRVLRVIEAVEAVSNLQSVELLLTQTIATAQAAMAALTERQALWKERQKALAELAAIESKRVAVEQLINETRDLQAAFNAYDARSAERTARELAIANRSRQVDETDAKLRDLRQQLADADAVLAGLRQQDSALTAALATIASLVTHEDRECPVCRSHFEPPRLLELALAASERSSPVLTQAEQNRRALLGAEQSTLASRRKSLSELEQLRALEREDAEQHAALERHRSGLLSRDPLGNVTLDGASSFLDKRRTEFIEERANNQSRLTQLESARDLDAAEIQTLTEMQARVFSANQRLTALPRERLELRATIDRETEIASSLQQSSRAALEQAIANERVLVGATLTNEKAQEAHAATAVANAESRARETQQEVRAIDARIKGLSRSLEALETRWRDVGLEGAPQEERLASAIRQVSDDQVEAASWREVVVRLGQSLRAWETAEELRKLDADILVRVARERCGSEQELSQLLRNRAASARERVQRAVSVTGAVDRIRNLFRDVSTSYYEEVVAPLNVLEQRFARALTVRTPFDVGLSQRTAHGKTLLELTSTFEGRANSPKLSAAHLLSEGQLAATAFTQVVSMSTAYRWSSWPCLLLDDPVQHNDVLHVSAFVDLLRNLVRERSYQVILSTHDPEIAGFISRKLKSDGRIEQLTCRFEGLGENGVIWRV